MRSLPSKPWVSGECPSQADGSTSGQSKRTSAGYIGQTWLGHPPKTLTGSLTEVVDRHTPPNPRCRLRSDAALLREWARRDGPVAGAVSLTRLMRSELALNPRRHELGDPVMTVIGGVRRPPVISLDVV